MIFEENSAFAVAQEAAKFLREQVKKQEQWNARSIDIRETRSGSVHEAGRNELRNLLYDALTGLRRGNTLGAQRSIEEALDWVDQL